MFLQTTVRLFICFKVKLYVSWCYINEPKLAPVYWPICCSFLHSRNISSRFTSVRLKTGPPHLLAMVKTNFGALKTPASAILQSSLASPRHEPLWTAHLLGVPSPLPFRVVVPPSLLAKASGRSPAMRDFPVPPGPTKTLYLVPPNKAHCELLPPCGPVFSLSSSHILELTTSGPRTRFW